VIPFWTIAPTTFAFALYEIVKGFAWAEGIAESVAAKESAKAVKTRIKEFLRLDIARV
jgi:hypothetical protein